MTINAAWQLGLEEETGSISVGKSADFVVLSGNPLTTSNDELENISVLETWLKGQPAEWRPFNKNAFKAILNILGNMF